MIFMSQLSLLWVPKEQVGGSNQVMECEVLKQIAKARGKSVTQACLRWVYEQGGSVLVKSFSKERLKENLHIFDWELSAQDSEMINQLPQKDFLELSSYQMSALINLPRIYGMVKLLEHGKM
ncbi:hypothetical protein TEA_029096 [Camellia sinensis var. sinensis]|uniref:NADP-dependent oxidoreductase domain-containing protein n=1 Tax=Camellia sinensis var. sinensis TaxID=542762 RepID=A0A4S4DT75_CAMSN|nr:hypothetical protein TEA_029096 [Camellia sinensis var. sinensis]